MTLIKALHWRYATKRMNGRKIPKEKLDNILEATRLSPSSMGLQPYTVLVIENVELRKKIQTVANNQPQITEASHLLVFTAWTDITPQQVEDYIHQMANVRKVGHETLDGFKNALLRVVDSQTPEQRSEWAARQAYIAFGTAIAAAAVEEVDATPMEGFNAQALDELLQLKEKDLHSVTLLTLGYRDTEKDQLATAKKVRREKEKLFIELA